MTRVPRERPHACRKAYCRGLTVAPTAEASAPAMHTRLLLRFGLGSSASPSGVTRQAQGVVQHFGTLRGTATSALPEAAKTTETSGGSGASFKNKRRVLYPAAAVVALTSVAAAKAHQQSEVQEDGQYSPLLDAPWVQQIPQQQDVLQVLSAKSLDTHSLLRKDHIVSLANNSICFQQWQHNH